MKNFGEIETVRGKEKIIDVAIAATKKSSNGFNDNIGSQTLSLCITNNHTLLLIDTIRDNKEKILQEQRMVLTIEGFLSFILLYTRYFILKEIGDFKFSFTTLDVLLSNYIFSSTKKDIKE